MSNTLFDRIEQSRVYDCTMRLPIVLYSLYTLVHDVTHFAEQFAQDTASRGDDVPPDFTPNERRGRTIYLLTRTYRISTSIEEESASGPVIDIQPKRNEHQIRSLGGSFEIAHVCYRNS